MTILHVFHVQKLWPSFQMKMTTNVTCHCVLLMTSAPIPLDYRGIPWLPLWNGFEQLPSTFYQ